MSYLPWKLSMWAGPINTPILSIATLFYDYALTFGEEVERFWKQPRNSWLFVLFAFNRYCTLVSYVLVFAFTFWQLSSKVSDVPLDCMIYSLLNAYDYRCKP